MSQTRLCIGLDDSVAEYSPKQWVVGKVTLLIERTVEITGAKSF